MAIDRMSSAQIGTDTSTSRGGGVIEVGGRAVLVWIAGADVVA